MKQTTTPDLWGHPRGLFYLFFAELWERFSFYGMKALLILYMTQELLYSDHLSFGIFSAYMSLVYITPLWGGLLADKILGYRKAIMLGGLLMAAGHFVLTIPNDWCFYLALGLIIVGNGFFKPNISSLVGSLYAEQDTRRDAGFTIFYLGINTGATAAPLCCAYLASLYGWHAGFLLAGLGMLLGLVCFQYGIRQSIFGDEGLVPNPEQFAQRQQGLHKGQWILIGSLLATPVFSLIIYFHDYEHYLVLIATLALVAYILHVMRVVSPAERNRLIVVVYFTILGTLFWALFEQTGSSLVLFADRNVQLQGITAAQTNSINPAFIILLAIPFSMLWNYLGKKGKNPSAPVKFGLGLCLLGFGAIIFGSSASSADALAQTPMSYLVMGYFVLTLGEMCLSPIGLSKVTELSPAKYIAFVMGVWFSASFYGHFFAGKIAQLTAVVDSSASNNGNLFDPIIEYCTQLNPSIAQQKGPAFEQLYSYVSVYISIGSITILVGFVALLLSPFMNRLIASENA